MTLLKKLILCGSLALSLAACTTETIVINPTAGDDSASFIRDAIDVIDAVSESSLVRSTEKAIASRIFLKNQAINPDYVGDFRFNSGIIHEGLVKGKTNDTYLRTDWRDMSYSDYGSIFLDYMNIDENDQNLVIYGHYVYTSLDPSLTQMFSPLHSLKDPENYEDNKLITIIFEHNIVTYQVATLFICDLVDGEYPPDDLEYYNPSYTPEYFEEYVKRLAEVQLYETGVDLSYEDHLLTLQTCVENRDDQRLVVIAKEISRISLD